MTAVAVPAMPAPPFGAIENAEPGTACVWSRFSDQVTVTVVPLAATVAELIVGAVVSGFSETRYVIVATLPLGWAAFVGHVRGGRLEQVRAVRGDRAGVVRLPPDEPRRRAV